VLSAMFDGSSENPLLHFSESHLDTLGLCYFLAMRKREAVADPVFKVLVLDDVLHSVDASHRGRVAELLKREFGDHQLIITTHDFHFYEALRRALGSGYKYIRINNWDLSRGPVLGDPLTDHERILDPDVRDSMAQENLSAVGGRFFEWLLRETTEALQVAIPARFSREQDIGSMWPALAAKLRQQKGFTAAYPTLVTDLERNTWVRNACGAHYNETASPPSQAEVQEFAAFLAKLYGAMWCPTCREFIHRGDHDAWMCSCGNGIAYTRQTPQAAAAT